VVATTGVAGVLVSPLSFCAQAGETTTAGSAMAKIMRAEKTLIATSSLALLRGVGP
jgi:hypothetical protein